MTTPRIETISANIATDIDAITTGAGFNQTLVAVRAKRFTFSDIKPENGKVLIIEQDDEALEREGTQTDEWTQRYALQAYVIDSKATVTAIGTRLNQVKSDIRKKMIVDRTRGGIALNTKMLGSAPFIDKTGYTGIVVDMEVHYRTAIGDPYTA